MESTLKRTGAMERWASLLRVHTEEGVPPERFLDADAEIGQSLAPLLALAAMPEVVERSFRQGLVLCMAQTPDFTALLYWRGRVFAVYRHDMTRRGVDDIMRDLKEFRLGWLPEETARASGGGGTAFAALPPEAEGFPVTWFTGPERRVFDGHGRIWEPAP